MAKKNSRNTKGRIISAAWKLFYEQGYEGTTVEDIVFESGTSKGSFYHYFDGKDALMGTLAYVFDEKYEELIPALDPNMGALETLAYINHELYVMIEASVSIDLLTRLLSTQLLARGEKHLLDRSRVYFRLLRRIVRQGAERGELRREVSVDELVRAFAMWERAQLYDWCLCGGDYSLVSYAEKMTPLFLESFRAPK
ncbi:TetR/AcrR family transcriptional regulator [Neopoerus faecalis]|jgi:AcrR family transcriptional regulator|uniref:TetR/AcrR family transcriptional regulator n=1 Tax=Neopoerus faecalis TaxID=3032125 RepID=UPI002570879B|nr:TetR/AcrR family transcriptional regulator [Neopoerus faecalis]